MKDDLYIMARAHERYAELAMERQLLEVTLRPNSGA
jgi:hypothetical protein